MRWFDREPPTESAVAWTVAAWIKPSAAIEHPTLVVGFGDGLDFSGAQRFFAADDRGWFFFVGGNPGKLWTGGPANHDAPTTQQIGAGRVDSGIAAEVGQWQHLAATYDGATLHLYVDGRPAGKKQTILARAAMQVLIAPPPPWADGGIFAGRVARLTVWDRCLATDDIAKLARPSADLHHLTFAAAPDGPTPAPRTGPFIGRRSSQRLQDPKTVPGPLPTVELSRKPPLDPTPKASPRPDGQLVLDRGWKMADAQTVDADPETIASARFDASTWYDATVPGTALTTLVQQGIYPDPLHGLNNLLIPDSLSRKSWWYRVRFDTPSGWDEKQIHLVFHGINYHAEAWLNGQRLGGVTGAFQRGRFDATKAVARNSANTLAVRIWPQPHYGVTHEQSAAAGIGPNGADGVLDGPTFICTEGWDWIPTIRDRCTGIWQDVVLRATGPVALGDPQVITALPKLPDLSQAEVTIRAELRNLTSMPQRMVLEGSLAGATFTLPVSLPPGETATVAAGPKHFPQLAIHDPQLWWPNGYGTPTLHNLVLRVKDEQGRISDTLTQRIGLRTLSYETKPQLTVLVNGRRIFCKGGNWGLDDGLKRISRERLEPYIRLHRDAHLTMIRNWCGQSTSEAFFDLCDEYGILVYNEFWMSTEDHDLPPINAELMLANVADTVKRFRDHACIAIWSGRNEGTPPKWINPDLEALLQTLDGTRLYVPNSWRPPVSGGGPYGYVPPGKYFELAGKKPFTTELGIDSLPTFDTLQAMVPAGDLWPAKGAWEYHDFRPRNPYLAAIRDSYGVSTDARDLARRAQMVNYVNHRAMFEGWNARLFNPASGVLLWMTHPAWPSMVWQLYSQDYDAHAAYYGAKKACEPIHVQWNAADDTVAVINNLFEPIDGASLTASIHTMDGRELVRQEYPATAAPSAATVVTTVQWPEPAADSPVQLLSLELHDRDGKCLSRNLYWRAAKHEAFGALQDLPAAALEKTLTIGKTAGETRAVLTLSNPGRTVALMAHATLRNAATGDRILPAYWSDNYISLLPGERRELVVCVPAGRSAEKMVVTLDGWNIMTDQVRVETAH